MKLEDIITLAKAGYTAEDIKAMNTPEDVQAEPEEKPEETPAEPEEVPEEDQEAEPKAEDLGAMFKAMMGELQGMREDMRRRSLMEDSVPIENPVESANRILAQIIDPPVLKPKEGKKGKNKWRTT